MRKQEAKGKVLDRFPSMYPRAIVAVMVKIIELIKLGDWKREHIDGKYSQPKDKKQLGFLVNLSSKSITRALGVLLTERFIEQSPDNPNSYSVNTSRLLDLPSSFKSRRESAETEKRKNRDRMRIARSEKLIATLKEGSSGQLESNDQMH